MAVTMSDNDDYDSDNWGSETAEFPTWPDGGQQPQKETITHTSGDNAPPDKRELQTEAIVASFTPRAYQLEMLEESLRRNIIVAVSVVLKTKTFHYRGLTSTDGYRQRQDAYC